MAAITLLLLFGHFVVSLTLAPDYLVFPYSLASFILFSVMAFYAVYKSPPI